MKKPNELLRMIHELTRDQERIFKMQELILSKREKENRIRFRNIKTADRWKKSGYIPKWLRSRIDKLEGLLSVQLVSREEGVRILGNDFTGNELYDLWEVSFISQRDFESDYEWYYRIWNLEAFRMMFCVTSLFKNRIELLDKIDKERKETIRGLALDRLSMQCDTINQDHLNFDKLPTELFNLKLN